MRMVDQVSAVASWWWLGRRGYSRTSQSSVTWPAHVRWWRDDSRQRQPLLRWFTACNSPSIWPSFATKPAKSKKIGRTGRLGCNWAHDMVVSARWDRHREATSSCRDRRDNGTATGAARQAQCRRGEGNRSTKGAATGSNDNVVRVRINVEQGLATHLGQQQHIVAAIATTGSTAPSLELARGQESNSARCPTCHNQRRLRHRAKEARPQGGLGCKGLGWDLSLFSQCLTCVFLYVPRL